jgi:hypothetical protein
MGGHEDVIVFNFFNNAKLDIALMLNLNDC